MAEKNLTIMRTAWFEGTNDFQQRVPEPTQQNLQQVYDTILDNPALYNQFCDVLMNRIGLTLVRQRKWENPLAAFKGAKLVYGSTIQEIIPKWIKAHSYRDDVRDLLKMNRPALEVAYHTMSRQDKYMISITRDEMRQAFVNETGLSSLVSALMQVPYNSDNYDEYKIMLELIAKHEKFHGFFKQNMKQVPTDENSGKEFLRLVRQYVGALKFPTTTYSARDVEGVPVFAKADELVLLYTPELASVISVEVLASLFNVDKAQLNVKTVLVDEFPIKDCFALLTTKDWFVCNDIEYTMQNFYNGSTLTANYYLHHWGVYSTSPFVPAIMFTTGQGSEIDTITQIITGLEINAEKTVANPGEIVQLFPNLYGTFGDGEDVKPKTACTYQFKYDETYQNSRTYIDKYNRLHIQKSAKTGDVLHIKATSTYNNPSSNELEEYTATIDIQIGGGSKKVIYLKSPIDSITLDGKTGSYNYNLIDDGERVLTQDNIEVHVPIVKAETTEFIQKNDIINGRMNVNLVKDAENIIFNNNKSERIEFPYVADFANNPIFNFTTQENMAIPEEYGAIINTIAHTQALLEQPKITNAKITDENGKQLTSFEIMQPTDISMSGDIYFDDTVKDFAYAHIKDLLCEVDIQGQENMVCISMDGGKTYVPYVKEEFSLYGGQWPKVMVVVVGAGDPVEQSWYHYNLVGRGPYADKDTKKDTKKKKIKSTKKGVK